MGKCESANSRSYDLSSVLKVECKFGSGFLAFQTKIETDQKHRWLQKCFFNFLVSESLYALNLVEDLESFLCGAYVTSLHIYLAIKTGRMLKYLWIHFMTINLSYSNESIYLKKITIFPKELDD